MYYDINKIDKDKKYNISLAERRFGQTYHLCQEYLIKLNFNINSDGFNYWITAINIYAKNRRISMINLYDEIGKRTGKTGKQIERLLRYASETSKETIRDVYNYKGKLSNSAILKLLTDVPIQDIGKYEKVKKLETTVEYEDLMKHIPNIE